MNIRFGEVKNEVFLMVIYDESCYVDEKEITKIIPNFYKLSEKDRIKLLEVLYRRNLKWIHGFIPKEYEKITRVKEVVE